MPECSCVLVGRAGLEPARLAPTDLKSVPFTNLGTFRIAISYTNAINSANNGSLYFLIGYCVMIALCFVAHSSFSLLAP